uniref:DUF295 domain-containing protein n=1 Tax=Setaria viridis TaxID=4556 RepID=A0A4U6U9U2_SETVI|nr:hypothetical protein SEVIR_5G002650v2 [Setaria viridis]
MMHGMGYWDWMVCRLACLARSSCSCCLVTTCPPVLISRARPADRWRLIDPSSMYAAVWPHGIHSFIVSSHMIDCNYHYDRSSIYFFSQIRTRAAYLCVKENEIVDHPYIYLPYNN